MVRDMIGNGDDLITHCHDRVITLFEQVVMTGISAMECRNKRNPRLARSKIGTPGRRARTRMNNINALCTDKINQRINIAAHGKQIF